jgi:hypothetical protein
MAFIPLALAVSLFAAAAPSSVTGPPVIQAPAMKAPAARAAGRASNFPLARATPAEVKAWLGEPVVANEEGKGGFWTYRLEDCALMVFFKDDGQGLRVSGVATGPRRRAETAPDADACITNARK